MAAKFDIYEARTHLYLLLDRVVEGERIIISRAGRPVADLVPHRRRAVPFGYLRDRIR